MTQVFDDRNPAIVYSPGWTNGGVSTEYDSTSTYTQRARLTATLTFHGVSVAVFGTIGPSNSDRPPALSSYTIDGYDTLIFEPPFTPDWQHRSRFYQSGLLRNDRHTLVVTSLRNDSDLFILDYFVVESSASSVTSTSTSTSPIARPESSTVSSFTLSTRPTVTTTRPGSSTVSAVVLFPNLPTTPSSMSSNTTAPSESPQLGDSVRKPPITTATFVASITVAAATLIILAITIIYFFLRRRRRVESNANIISIFSDKRLLPDLPINQKPSSSSSHAPTSSHEDPPPYEPRLHGPAGGKSRSAPPF